MSNRQSYALNTESYRKFLQRVQQDAVVERQDVNRRMGAVLLWCFLLPGAVYILVVLLLKFRILPLSVRSSLDWITLTFPVLYTVKFFWSEVFKGLPSRVSEGGIGNVLVQAEKDSQWREHWCSKMTAELGAVPETWRFIQTSFASDLEAFKFRTRYLTVLAGALFFLVTQGLDLLIGPVSESSIAWQNSRQFFSWLENLGAGALQLVGFGLFLTLMHLSGSQTYHWLSRYSVGIELILGQKEQEAQVTKKEAPVA